MSAAPAGAKYRKPAGALLRRFGPLLGLLLLCAVLGVLSDRFLTVDNLLNVFRQSAVNALLSLGQLVVIITAGIDLSVGSILGLCCVLVALLLKAGAPPLVSVLAGLAIGLALGAINGVLLTPTTPLGSLTGSLVAVQSGGRVNVGAGQ